MSHGQEHGREQGRGRSPTPISAEPRDASPEENDLLRRSVKKVKGLEVEEATMDDCMGEGEEEGRAVTAPGQEDDAGKEKENTLQADARPLVSYKDKLLSFNGAAPSGSEDVEEVAAFLSDVNEEDESVMEVIDQPPDEDPACPVIPISLEEKKELCKPWRSALIIKLLGKRLGMRFLKLRLQKIWNLQNGFEFIDMENDFYLVRFKEVQDFNFVLQEGPWMVADHYLIVQRWVPNFDPYDNVFKMTSVWARIPGLPIEFYNKHFLWRLGNRIGRTLKVDSNTLRRKEDGDEDLVERAKFARICVEIDLRKRFLSKFKLLNRTYRIEYEGLHFICFKCGRYGHRKEECPEAAPSASHEMAVDDHSSKGPAGGASGNPNADAPTIGADDFGPWMLAQKGRKAKPVQRNQSSAMIKRRTDGVTNRVGPSANTGQDSGSIHGSRFIALSDLEQLVQDDQQVFHKEDMDVDLEGASAYGPSHAAHAKGKHVLDSPTVTSGTHVGGPKPTSKVHEGKHVVLGSSSGVHQQLPSGSSKPISKTGTAAARSPSQRGGTVVKLHKKPSARIPVSQHKQQVQRTAQQETMAHPETVSSSLDGETIKSKPPDKHYLMQNIRQGLLNLQNMDPNAAIEAMGGVRTTFPAI